MKQILLKAAPFGLPQHPRPAGIAIRRICQKLSAQRHHAPNTSTNRLRRRRIMRLNAGEYPVEEVSDEKVISHVALNPGTRKIETVDGQIIWQEPKN